MKTEQEQIEEIEKVLKDSVADYKHLKKKGVCYCYAETLIDCGYDDISEYKAEIERLQQEVRDTDKIARNTIEQYRAKNEELENALKQSEDNYSRAYERLKAQGREIGKLKDENEALKNDLINSEGNLNHITTEFEQLKDEIIYLERKIAIRDNALKDRDKAIEMLEGKQDTIVKQAKIDVLNKAKERLDNAPNGWAYTTYIDEFIKEVQND